MRTTLLPVQACCFSDGYLRRSRPQFAYGLFGEMFDEHALKDGFDDVSIFGPKLADGLELQAHLFVGPAIVGVEDEIIKRDMQCIAGPDERI